MQVSRLHPTADIHSSVRIEPEVSIWQFAHVREGCLIGDRCIIGRGVYLGPGVKIGSDVKIQNYSLIYEPAEIQSGVFIGPGVIFTNDRNPRAVNSDGSLKTSEDWRMVGVRVGVGASIGAGSTCVAPIEIGPWAMVAAGSVVVNDVPPFALVAGNPARFLGWVGKAGFRLSKESSSALVCPETGQKYILSSDQKSIIVEES